MYNTSINSWELFLYHRDWLKKNYTGSKIGHKLKIHNFCQILMRLGENNYLIGWVFSQRLGKNCGFLTYGQSLRQCNFSESVSILKFFSCFQFFSIFFQIYSNSLKTFHIDWKCLKSFENTSYHFKTFQIFWNLSKQVKNFSNLPKCYLSSGFGLKGFFGFAFLINLRMSFSRCIFIDVCNLQNYGT